MNQLWGFLQGGSSNSDAAPLRNHEVGGRRLREEQRLSEGGFGYVVRARDLETSERFALKKVLCQDEEGLKAALKEAEVLEDLPSHKNIVGYFGHVVVHPPNSPASHRQVLTLLELCPGGHLLDYLDRHKGVLSEKKVMKAFIDVAEAIFWLHSQKPPIQHRDLKLDNVLHGSDGFWKVVDFGSWSSETYDLAAVEQKELSMLSEEVKRNTTMHYRPPEMVDVYLRFPIMVKVDIWALGCILYALLFNKLPFQEAEVLAIREARFTLPNRSPPPSPKIIDLLIWLLAVDPRHRPSARALVTALWQWDDLKDLTMELQLPQPVVEKKKQLLANAALFAPRQENGQAGAPTDIPPEELARLAARVKASEKSRNAGSGNVRAGAYAAVPAPVAPVPAAPAPVDAAWGPASEASAEPWVAFFPEDGNSSGQVEETRGTVEEVADAGKTADASAEASRSFPAEDESAEQATNGDLPNPAENAVAQAPDTVASDRAVVSTEQEQPS